jgi:hypothetical protein
MYTYIHSNVVDTFRIAAVQVQVYGILIALQTAVKSGIMAAVFCTPYIKLCPDQLGVFDRHWRCTTSPLHLRSYCPPMEGERRIREGRCRLRACRVSPG